MQTRTLQNMMKRTIIYYLIVTVKLTNSRASCWPIIGLPPNCRVIRLKTNKIYLRGLPETFSWRPQDL